ncbi:MAG: hypothetical protein K8I30_04880 [Anaerolineae bacterium]|nr:hypothetical protein [Anaerolineae bacterium]
MLDTLDLDKLRSDIKAEKRAGRRSWIICALVILGLAIFILVFAAIVLTPNQNLSSACARCAGAYIQLFIATLLLVSIFVVGLTFYINLRRRQKQAKRARQDLPPLNLPPAFKSYESLISIGMVILLIGIIVIFRLSFENAVVLFFAVFSIPTLFISFAAMWARAPLYRAKYDEAIRRIHIVEGWLNNNAGILIAESLALIFAGKSSESDRLHLQLIAQTQQAKVYDWLAYNNYGVELTYQRRFGEALPLLETAVRLQPQIANAYDSLANWYLSQNASAERALALANFGLQLEPTLTSGLKENSRSLRLATRAWAEARTGRSDAAKATLRAALKAANPKYIPLYAELHRITGETLLALGEISNARSYFEKAATLDPTGRFGKLAQSALEQLSQVK